jgi:S1-C subfamily serine protease
MNSLEQLSQTLAERVAGIAGVVVSLEVGRRAASGIVWRAGVVVTSEQMLPEDAADIAVTATGWTARAKVAGRDPGTNVAVLKLDGAAAATLPAPAEPPRVGQLALVIGADRIGAPTARMALVHAAGEAWHSMAGGRIDAMIRLDARLGQDEGGPVLSARGDLIGMSTAGPHRRTLVIPAATIARVVEPLLAEGAVPRGWLGVGLQPVKVPESLREPAGASLGLMVVDLAGGGPAETAGVLPGDILLGIDDAAVTRPRMLSQHLSAERIGQVVTLKLLRAGGLHTLSATIGARPRQ